MVKHSSRRKKQVFFTVLLSILFILLLTVIFWINSSSNDKYIPGEEIAGLTSDLARNIPDDYPKVTFINVSETAGIQFDHFEGKRTIQLPEDMGSGAAWGDFDNDGWIDLFAVNFAGPVSKSETELAKSKARSALYHNNQDGTFSNVANEAGLDILSWGNAAAWGDYDNDGWIDLVITSFGKNSLFKNNHDGTFSDLSQQSGIGNESGYWTGASWGDYNRDGFIDLYICGYVDYNAKETGKMTLQYNTEVPSSINPSSFPPVRNLMFMNNQDGTFSEVAEGTGVANENGRSLASAWCDFDEDGWPDLYVANDVSDNVLYRNSGNGTFEEISHSAFVADYRGAMGIAVGDWDQDTDMDMFITHWMAQENALYNNLLAQSRNLNTSSSRQARFMDEADRYGLGQVALQFIGFGTSFFDYNNDGLLDLFVVNGSTFQQREDPEKLIPMPDQVFWNKGRDDGFFDVSKVSGDYFNNEEFVGRGAAIGDYDNDGDLDVFVANNIGPGILLRNEGGNKDSWLKLKLKGTESNSDAFGAQVRIVSTSGVQVNQLGAQGPYLSQNSLILHFGLGDDQRIDSLFVCWPSGVNQMFMGLKTNQMITLVEGAEPQK